MAKKRSAKKSAKKRSSKKRSSAKKTSAAKGRKKGKLTPAGRKRIAAASRARWRARKGAGTPGKKTKGKKGHIPLKVLETNHKRLGALIETRKKSPGSWS